MLITFSTPLFVIITSIEKGNKIWWNECEDSKDIFFLIT